MHATGYTSGLLTHHQIVVKCRNVKLLANIKWSARKASANCFLLIDLALYRTFPKLFNCGPEKHQLHALCFCIPELYQAPTRYLFQLLCLKNHRNNIMRSEERRVGKECRSRGSRDASEKRKDRDEVEAI